MSAVSKVEIVEDSGTEVTCIVRNCKEKASGNKPKPFLSLDEMGVCVRVHLKAPQRQSDYLGGV